MALQDVAVAGAVSGEVALPDITEEGGGTDYKPNQVRCSPSAWTLRQNLQAMYPASHYPNHRHLAPTRMSGGAQLLRTLEGGRVHVGSQIGVP